MLEPTTAVPDEAVTCLEVYHGNTCLAGRASPRQPNDLAPPWELFIDLSAFGADPAAVADLDLDIRMSCVFLASGATAESTTTVSLSVLLIRPFWSAAFGLAADPVGVALVGISTIDRRLRDPAPAYCFNVVAELEPDADIGGGFYYEVWRFARFVSDVVGVFSFV